MDDRVHWEPVIPRFKHKLEALQLARDVQSAQQSVLDTALQLMREVVSNWNQTTITCRLPPELLAACFSYLPLNDLLAVTRVCQCWRATALAAPELWSTLTFDLDRYANADILGLAVSRAGQVLLDYTFSVVRSTKKTSLARALAEHMYRLRRLSWTIPGIPGFMLQAAPPLESFSGRLMDFIPSELFGGTAARLGTLKVQALCLPETCPALSTVTTLCASLSFGLQNEAESLVHLFAVCPLLEHLELSDLVDTHFLPLTVLTPTRLRTLILRTYKFDSSDLVRYLRAWAPANPRLSRVRLDMKLRLRDAAPIFEEAETLSVSQHEGYAACAKMEIRSTRGRMCTLLLRHPSNLHYDQVSSALAGEIHANSAHLGRLRSLSALVTVLDALFKPPPALPALRALAVLVEKWAPELPIAVQMTHVEGYGSRFPIESLECLLDTQDMGRLSNIAVIASTSTCAFEQTDFDGLLLTLEKSLPQRDQQDEVVVVVRGFRSDLVADVVLPRVQGYSIALLATESARRRSP
ncbi:hypothetical protein AURDEDRAFT_130800 [Auricularia subglabra TFB-10046 SS5]|uniref:F-box domain-containing protein n=1 Tax=Auricularia subglabra (strain TFB-10046 / SS5) TaxID=717982 RepID=J0D7L2_AURST|nr:hypothetical protein AURDEDRAFT_130800 [Auricularia subglabra TFB-10046 SS5]